MRCQNFFDKKNILFLSYLSFFAVFSFAYYFLSSNNSFYSGIIGISLIILYPVSAFVYGYKTGDRLRAPLAGIVSYTFLILFISLSINFQNSLSSGYLLLFTGYHLTLLICLGFIGFLASGKENLHLIVAGILSVVWVLIFISGIS